jgi:hypothetical protein
MIPHTYPGIPHSGEDVAEILYTSADSFSMRIEAVGNDGGVLHIDPKSGMKHPRVKGRAGLRAGELSLQDILPFLHNTLSASDQVKHVDLDDTHSIIVAG